MVKGRVWSPKTLEQMHGTAGVGVMFLDEMFSASANPRRRQHQKAIQAMLQCLLPDSDTHIKRKAVSIETLRQASGYAGRPREFRELMRILHVETRLISPFDPYRIDEDTSHDGKSEEYYQLTHDYLVGALRRWLTSEQRKTRRGRAALKLAERSATWQPTKDRRLLPPWWEAVGFTFLTRQRDWTSPQRAMMGVALRRIAVTCFLIVGTLLISAHFAIKSMVANKVRELHTTPDPARVSVLIDELALFRIWADPRLAQFVDSDRNYDERSTFRARVARVRWNKRDVSLTYWLNAVDEDPDDLAVVLHEYRHRGHVPDLESIWNRFDKATTIKRFLVSASVAAQFDPNSQNWEQKAGLVSNALLSEDLNVRDWSSNLRPVKKFLRPFLINVFSGETSSETRQVISATVLAEFYADNASDLLELFLRANSEQIEVIYDRLDDLDIGSNSLIDQLYKRLDHLTMSCFALLISENVRVTCAVLVESICFGGIFMKVRYVRFAALHLARTILDKLSRSTSVNCDGVAGAWVMASPLSSRCVSHPSTSAFFSAQY
jgi:hypothetical protein